MAKRFVVALILASTSLAGAAQPPSIKTIYTMDGCAPCLKVEAKLVKDGHKVCVLIRTSNLPPPKVREFPTVVYSDDYRDNGQRVLSGYYTAKPLVAAIKWKPKD